MEISGLAEAQLDWELLQTGERLESCNDIEQKDKIARKGSNT